MRIDANELALIGELTDSEFDSFRACVRILLSKTFLIRGFEHEEQLYAFALRNIRLLELWFSCADIELKRDEGLGVIACRAGHEMRTRLGREETCALLVFRLLYEERRADLRLSQFPSVTVGEFLRKYQTLTGIQPRKTRMADIFRRLSFFKLVSLSGDPADPDSSLVLFPSLTLALDNDAIEEIENALELEQTDSEADEDEQIIDVDIEDGEDES